MRPPHTGMLDAFMNDRTAELLFYVSKDVGAEATFVLFQFSELRDHRWWRFELLGSRQVAGATAKEEARAPRRRLLVAASKSFEPATTALRFSIAHQTKTATALRPVDTVQRRHALAGRQLAFCSRVIQGAFA